MRKDASKQLDRLETLANRIMSQANRPYAEGMQEELESFRKILHLFRLSFQEEADDFEMNYRTWRSTKARFRRTKRLFEMDAPPIVIQHEIEWLLTMIEHMRMIYNGNRPEFTKEQLEELAAQALIES